MFSSTSSQDFPRYWNMLFAMLLCFCANNRAFPGGLIIPYIFLLPLASSFTFCLFSEVHNFFCPIIDLLLTILGRFWLKDSSKTIGKGRLGNSARLSDASGMWCRNSLNFRTNKGKREVEGIALAASTRKSFKSWVFFSISLLLLDLNLLVTCSLISSLLILCILWLTWYCYFTFTRESQTNTNSMENKRWLTGIILFQILFLFKFPSEFQYFAM